MPKQIDITIIDINTMNVKPLIKDIKTIHSSLKGYILLSHLSFADRCLDYELEIKRKFRGAFVQVRNNLEIAIEGLKYTKLINDEEYASLKRQLCEVRLRQSGMKSTFEARGAGGFFSLCASARSRDGAAAEERIGLFTFEMKPSDEDKKNN